MATSAVEIILAPIITNPVVAITAAGDTDIMSDRTGVVADTAFRPSHPAVRLAAFTAVVSVADMPAAARMAAGRQRKQLFSGEKNQKTFAPTPAERLGRWPVNLGFHQE
jgi:hypothetical protein